MSTYFLRGLNRPLWVLGFSLAFLAFHILAQGTSLRLLSLQSEIQRLESEKKSLTVHTAALDQQLKRAKDLNYVERKAMDQLDMASEDDLVFTFSDE